LRVEKALESAYRLQAVGRTCLLEDVMNVNLGGTRANYESRRNLRV
jgi:hypothetical protein